MLCFPQLGGGRVFNSTGIAQFWVIELILCSHIFVPAVSVLLSIDVQGFLKYETCVHLLFIYVTVLEPLLNAMDICDDCISCTYKEYNREYKKCSLKLNSEDRCTRLMMTQYSVGLSNGRINFLQLYNLY